MVRVTVDRLVRAAAALRWLLGRWLWAPLLGKGIAWVAAFLALAHVGREAAESLERRIGETSPQEVVPAPERAAPAARDSPAIGTPSATAHASKAPCPDSGGDPSQGKLADGRIVLNLASAAALDSLPGIGLKRAEEIVALRERLGGRFRSLRDLLRIRGIGPRTLRRLEPHLVLDPPPPPEEPRDEPKPQP